MAKASDYPIGFPYGGKDGYYYGPNGIIGPYHRGNDYYTPTGTDLDVNGQVIGRTGATGKVSGPHIHVQLSPEANPTGKEWTVPGAVVIATGQTPVEGKYIQVRGTDGYVRMYFHLSEILVTKGQIIGDDMKNLTKTQVDYLSQIGWNRPAQDDEKAVYETQPADDVFLRVLNSPQNVEIRTKAANYNSVRGALDSAYAEIEKLRQESSGEAQKKLTAIMEILKEK